MRADPKWALVTMIVALGLVVPAALGLGLVWHGSPYLFSPQPALTFLPALILSILHVGNAAVLVPMVLFVLWNPQLFSGKGDIPRRSFILLAILTALSVMNVVASWQRGSQFRGTQYAVVCILNVVWPVSLLLAFVRSRNGKTSLRTSLFLNWMLFAWLGWYAFPFVGDLF